MKFIKIALVLVLTLCALTAQDATILPAQKSAIVTLATNSGFTMLSLDNYLQLSYNSDLENLSKDNAVKVIQAFQAGEKPSAELSSTNPMTKSATVVPAIKSTPKEQVLKASILEQGMSKRFYLVDGNIINGTILKIEGNICQIETPDGTLSIPNADILEETAKITKKDDTRYVGPVLRDNQQEIVI